MPHSKSTAYRLATQWLYDRIDYEKLARPGTPYRFTLERMRDLIVRLGHGPRLAGRVSDSCESPPERSGHCPERSGHCPRIVHIAGTKGKGSVASMIAAMLTAAGYRVGLYTSPHLVDLEERFRVDGCSASRMQMVDLIDSMRPHVDAMSKTQIGGPSFFELTTAIAIEHFHRNGCQFWVLETGLGGRLDSTNVFQSDVAVLTSIGLDHQHVLGNTIEKITKEKAGILKPGVPAVSGAARTPAQNVIRQTARAIGAPLIELGRDFQTESITDHSNTPSRSERGAAAGRSWGSSFELSLPGRTSRVPVSLALEGRHQIRNAATAIAAIDQLGVPIQEPSLAALGRVQIEARLERFYLPGTASVVLDSAHNPDSIAALVETVTRRFENRTVVGVFGTSVDKDAAAMLELLQETCDHVVFTRYHDNPRFVPTESLAELAGGSFPAAAFSLNEDPIAACAAAMARAGEAGVVMVCGSFFLAAEIRPWLVQQNQC